jgi:hypothetical protein
VTFASAEGAKSVVKPILVNFGLEFTVLCKVFGVGLVGIGGALRAIAVVVVAAAVVIVVAAGVAGVVPIGVQIVVGGGQMVL